MLFRFLSGRAWSVLLLSCCLTACGDRPVWALQDASNLPDLKFQLPAAGGKTLNSDELKGKIVLMFFGYVGCQDNCPETLTQLSSVLKHLGEAAKNVRLVYVSLDPQRDTPDIVQAYANTFNKPTIGLSGTDKQIEELARRYQVAYQAETPQPGADHYAITHSQEVYIFDKQGRARLLASKADSVSAISKDLQQLLTLTGN
ncbi:SCO family protein [Bordetella avium]|uniref:SCO family protein n=1 Tax=Bordetella avium TaxID=521 RepID=UPI000E09FCDE|nr:SCO family protein [Bordetella avium]RIQ14276.1 SCO family protein [Bordetella avium]RIQ39969.1 SCO family protein [Bordetella avium]RIQ44771.1 SCO family protein [Bordetella avium]RIQ45011.1 SCO family protein [Bordetella avium]RIQ47640.1 SCO family protein [Bordetella avium]